MKSSSTRMAKSAITLAIANLLSGPMTLEIADRITKLRSFLVWDRSKGKGYKSKNHLKHGSFAHQKHRLADTKQSSFNKSNEAQRRVTKGVWRYAHQVLN